MLLYQKTMVTTYINNKLKKNKSTRLLVEVYCSKHTFASCDGCSLYSTSLLNKKI